jgi:quercetin dioxygenase-like cupin family protein
MAHYIISLKDRPWEEWRPGVLSRSWSGEVDGASQVRVGEQIFKPGSGVSEHFHTYEEHLVIVEGALQLEVDGEKKVVEAPACVIIPPHTNHSFGCAGETPVHLYGALGAPIHETFFTAFPEGEAIREYEAGHTGGARRRVKVDPATRTATDVNE